MFLRRLWPFRQLLSLMSLEADKMSLPRDISSFWPGFKVPVVPCQANTGWIVGSNCLLVDDRVEILRELAVGHRRPWSSSAT